MLTVEKLKSLVTYDPETGSFTWNEKEPVDKIAKIFNRRYASKPAGSVTKDGYWSIMIEGKNYPSHRLAWLYVHGEWPAEDIDHISGDRGDNRLSNLRACSRAENHQNKAKNKNNSSGYVGVRFHVQSGLWVAAITANYKAHHLGCFQTREAAAEAYRDAKSQLHTFQPTLRGD